MDRESSWLNNMKEQRLEGIKQEGDCEEGDGDLKLKVGGKQWKRARSKLWKMQRNATSGKTRAREALVSRILGFRVC
jgi:hypothetical protein